MLHAAAPARAAALPQPRRADRCATSRTGEPVAELSPGQPRPDRARPGADGARRAGRSRRLTAAELLDDLRAGGRLFAEAELPLEADGATQAPEDYVRQLSATTGLPQALCRFNMEKIRHVLADMEAVLAGLTRGLDLGVLDRGWALAGRPPASPSGRRPTCSARSCPATRRACTRSGCRRSRSRCRWSLKPGREEPWTPLRVAPGADRRRAARAGASASTRRTTPAPPRSCCAAAGRCSSATRRTVAPWRDDPRVQIHGPGWSKVIFGEDQAACWETPPRPARRLDRRERRPVLPQRLGRLAARGGRRGRELAEALARAARRDRAPCRSTTPRRGSPRSPARGGAAHLGADRPPASRCPGPWT